MDVRGGESNSRYEKFLRYLDQLYARRECWALSYRGSFLTRGNNTNNFAEVAMRVLKDKILQRTKAFNLPQLFDLLTSRLETYYEARIVDVALGRWESFQRAKFLPQDGNIAASHIQQIEDKKFVVKGSTQTYDVDMDLELCSCPAGQTGAPCKHQAAVMKHYSCLSHSFLPINPEMRAELMKLTSAETISLDFLQPLRLERQSCQSFRSTHEPSSTHQEWSAPAGRKKVGLNSNVGLSYVRRSDSNLHRVHQA
ncbi:uncharacterized protein LOC117536831 [Gymnodraco acuticeps]|uniref:Uncharacterized protein LOC117536831 n=1 Tax=Gymnodraco acuticeps TaxID=8218 RepID=A0A6P8T2P6_GYMAC|nr:uncharacterized protein LOC117536831 [Gymnodraco acuticeps]